MVTGRRRQRAGPRSSARGPRSTRRRRPRVRSDLTDATGVYRIEGVADRAPTSVQFADPVGEYLAEWHADKADPPPPTRSRSASSDADRDAALAPDPANVPAAVVDARRSQRQVTDSAGLPGHRRPVAPTTPPPTPTVRSASRPDGPTAPVPYSFTELDGPQPRTSSSSRPPTATPARKASTSRMTRWFGGAQSYEAASPVPVPAAGANITLPLTGGISGTVTSESDLSIDGVYVRFFDEKGDPLDEDSSGFAEERRHLPEHDLVPGQLQGAVRRRQLRVRCVGARPGVVRRHQLREGQGRHRHERQDRHRHRRQPSTRTCARSASPRSAASPYLGGKVRAYHRRVDRSAAAPPTRYEWLVDGAVVGTGARSGHEGVSRTSASPSA